MKQKSKKLNNNNFIIKRKDFFLLNLLYYIVKFKLELFLKVIYPLIKTFFFKL